MKLYRFSPMQSKDEFLEAIRYAAVQTTALAEKCIDIPLTTESLTIFTHYPDEFERLSKFVEEMGEPYNEHNGPRVKLKEPITVGTNVIKFVRVRNPDPYRMQVGCVDYLITDYQDFKNRFLATTTALHSIKRPEYEMIEFADPDFDVLAYVVPS
jgi:hypothetical protein